MKTFDPPAPVPDDDAKAHSARVVAYVRDEIARAGGFIPLVRYIPLMQVAKMPEWLVILLLVPFANLVVFILMWAKVCEARGKSPWLVILWFIPIVNIAFLPYLAFSE